MQNLNLKNLKERGISFGVLLILVSFFSCKTDKDNRGRIVKDYYYEVSYKNNNNKNYTHRKYVFTGDTIMVNVVRFDENGNVLPSDGENAYYLNRGDNIMMLKGKKASPTISGVAFTTKRKDSCWAFFHPFYHKTINCYKGLNNEGLFVFSSSQSGDDGHDWEMFLDENYSLVKKISNTPLENFKSEIRVDPNKIPQKILDKTE